MTLTLTRWSCSEGSVKINGKQFAPPSGFTPLILGASDFASDTVEIFSDLDGKQLWHISAPASVNIASIKTLDLEAAMRGETILSESGINYSMQETSSEYESLMLTEDTSARYKPTRVKISKSFKLGIRSDTNDQKSSTQEADHQSPSKTASSFVAQNSGQKKPLRQQPEGLHMQYQPFGSGIVKGHAEVVASPAKKTGVTSKNLESPVGTLVGKNIVIDDPMIASTSSSRKVPDDTPKPLIFSAPMVPDEDVEMENAPSPSKKAGKAKAAPLSSPSKVTEKITTPSTASQDTGQANTKKKRKSKLANGSSL